MMWPMPFWVKLAVLLVPFWLTVARWLLPNWPPFFRAFPVAGVDLVVVTHGGGVQHMAVAILVGEVHVAGALLV